MSVPYHLATNPGSLLQNHTEVLTVLDNQSSLFFTALKIQVEFFWVVMPCSEDGGNVGILLQHYTMSQPRRH
jgi:hypothetical protein